MTLTHFISPLTLTIGLLLCLLVLSSCEKNPSNILDTQGIPPFLLSAELSPSSINTDTIQIGSLPKPDDVLTMRVRLSATVATGAQFGLARAVLFSIKRQFQSSVIASGSLPETGGGIFSGSISFEIKRNEVGILYIDFTAESDQGYRSNSIIMPISIIRSNRPPVISNLLAPVTVTLGNQDQLIRLKLKAIDPDGGTDIVRVIFNSFLPDGRASSDNPIQMFDDGNLQGSGDEVRADSVYTRTVLLRAGTTTGTYRFEFQAFDRLNEGSNVIIHRLTVSP